MHVRYWSNYLKFAVAAVILFFLWLFNKDYLTPLLIGFFVAVLTFPIFNFIKEKLQNKLPKQAKNIAVVLTVILTTTVVVLVANIFISQIIKEIPKFISQILDGLADLKNNEQFKNLLNNLGVDKDSFTKLVDDTIVSTQHIQTGNGQKIDIAKFASSGEVNRVLSIGGQTFNIIFTQLTSLVIFFLAWINGLASGKDWLDNIFKLLPVSNEEAVSIKVNLKTGIRNVLYANLLSGALHATICFFLMLIFGVPNIWIYTLIIFFIGFLPLSPSELAYVIPISYIFSKSLVLGILVSVCCEFFILWVNNVFLPRIIAGTKDGNPLLILTSVLSGISIFGVMGFLIAPVIMIFVQTLYKILKTHIEQEKLENVN